MKIAPPTLGGGQLWGDRRWRSGWRLQRNALTGHHRLLDPSDRRHAFGSFERCHRVLVGSAPPTDAEELVVLLHGLGRTRRSMRSMAQALQEAGHRVAALDYPSTRRPIEAHVEQLREVLSNLEGVRRVSFVTHSLGGVLARCLLAEGGLPLEVRRIVMCAPPNQGSALARVLNRRVGPAFRMVMGPAGSQLTRPPAIPAPSVPFIVIAGSRAPRGLNPLLEGDDDGVVRVEETKLEGMREHVVVPSIHTFVMDHPAAQAAALRFLDPSSPADG